MIEKHFPYYLIQEYGSINANLIDHFSDEYHFLVACMEKLEEYEMDRMAASIGIALGGKKKDETNKRKEIEKDGW